MSYELEHSGILGQKWGRRRFQYKDGSLTPAGRSRYGVGKARNSNSVKRPSKSAAKVKRAKPASESIEKPKPKSVKDMSDQEIRDYLTRADLEKKYLAATIAPRQASLIEKTFVKFRDSALDKLATDAGKMVAKKILDKAFDDDVEKALNAKNKP